MKAEVKGHNRCLFPTAATPPAPLPQNKQLSRSSLIAQVKDGCYLTQVLEFLLPGFGPRLSKADAKPAFPLQTLVFTASPFRLFDAAAALFPLALRLHLII